jgi:hypothetical protein
MNNCRCAFDLVLLFHMCFASAVVLSWDNVVAVLNPRVLVEILILASRCLFSLVGFSLIKPNYCTIHVYADVHSK